LGTEEQGTVVPTSGVHPREWAGYRPSNMWCPSKNGYVCDRLQVYVLDLASLYLRRVGINSLRDSACWENEGLSLLILSQGKDFLMNHPYILGPYRKSR